MTTKNVLIADDDHDLSCALALRCEGLGISTRVAHDAMTALTEVHREAPDLICLDVNMPGGSGLSACEMISQDEELAGIPVIILTGCYDEETIRRCHKMCAYYVLKCPDIWGRMEPLVRELLGLDAQSARPTNERLDRCGSKGQTERSTRPLPDLYRRIAREVIYAQFDDSSCSDS
jgi:CheY-like chemotaxis protein